MRYALLLSLVAALPVAAQRPVLASPASPEHDHGWFAFGLGPGAPYDLVLSATANFGREHLLQIGLHSNFELAFFGRYASTNAVHVGPGLSRVDRWSRVALAAGPAVVWGLRDASDPGSRFNTAGVVVSGQTMFTPVPELGLGVDAFVNLNPVRSGYGLGLTFVFEANK